jgi:Peptidase family S41
MKLSTLLAIILFKSSIAFCQEYQFNNDFDFLSFTIRDTYAGYRDKVKGNEFDLLVKQVKRSQSKDTFALLSQMTAFFRDHHVFLYDDGISKQKIDTQQCKKDSQKIHRYFTNSKLKDKYEGYWLSDYDYCVIALKKVKSNPVTYHGYVMESKAKVIPGYCSVKMTLQSDGTFYTDYIGENLGFRAFFHSRFKNNNILWLNSFGGKWRRLDDYKPGILANKTTFSFKPNFVKIDTNTVMLKMPAFGTQNMKLFDSIIKTNAKLIEQANTLIIDIRNNAGGYINSYLSLLPYIYTQPIVHSGGYTLISNNFMKQYDDKIKKFTAKGDTANANIYINYRDTFLAKKGQFDYNEGDTLVKDLPILIKPKNIAVIINNNCLSAAELMLLNFKQSSKVTLFGERTGGAVDYLNAMTFKLPYGGYHLSVASVKRKFTDREPSYDKTGIPPDIEIGDNVPDWVSFVKKYYDEH